MTTPDVYDPMDVPDPVAVVLREILEELRLIRIALQRS